MEGEGRTGQGKQREKYVRIQRQKSKEPVKNGPVCVAGRENEKGKGCRERLAG